MSLELDLAAVRGALLGWFLARRRDLPFRRTCDPYAIWVSEIMLQQTQVATVIPFYERFLAELPTIAALAAAPDEQVLQLWAGLGYYSRARNLQAAARVVVAEHEGRFPEDPAAVRRLPGIGDYTAGAVLSIAFGLEVAAVDGNVERVLSRLAALEDNPKRNPGKARVRELAQRLVQGPDPGDLNQALMELGATVCRPPNPACGECPVAAWCVARAKGRQAELPRLPQRPVMQQKATAAAVVLHGGRVLVARRMESGVWGGLWEFPQVEVKGDAAEALVGQLRRRLGVEVVVGARVARVVHGIMNSRITLEAFGCELEAGAALRPDPEVYAAAEWIALEALGTMPMSAPHRKLAGLLKDG